MLQHPREFEAGLAAAGSELRYASGALFDFYIGYTRLSGRLARFIIPKVGGRGSVRRHRRRVRARLLLGRD